MSHEAPTFEPAQRGHASDDVFDQLAAAILKRELASGSSLPPERVLAEQFATSRIIARQAIHRLAELGLVRVRQGGATTILPIEDASDLRILELSYRLAPAGVGAIDPRDIIEKQLLQGLCLIDVATRRASIAKLASIDKGAQARCDAIEDEAAYVAFVEWFWRAVTQAGRNRIFEMEVSWWYRVLAKAPRSEHYAPSPLALRVAFYRTLSTKLRTGDDAMAYYMASARPLMNAMRARK